MSNKYDDLNYRLQLWRLTDPRNLPPLLKLDDVLCLLSISRATLYRGMDKGKYPRPASIVGKRGNRWSASDVAEAIKQQTHLHYPDRERLLSPEK